MDRQEMIDVLADAWSKLHVLKEYDGLAHEAGDTDAVAMIDVNRLLDRIKDAEDSLRALQPA